MNNISRLIRPELLSFEPYRSARDQENSANILLNANESPYSRLWKNVLINRYPEKQPIKLIELIAEICGVSKNQIVLARGGDELIDLLVRLFCRPKKDAIMICSPTYDMYSVCAKLQSANVIDVPLLKPAFRLDVHSLLANYCPNLKLIFLCSPNNPTGNSLYAEDVLTVCQQLQDKCMIVVDEAYIDYSDKPSLCTYMKQCPNLIIIRTFSKAYGLAGARCGFLLANDEIISWIKKIIPPYPVSSLTTIFIYETILHQQDEIKNQINIIREQRSVLFQSFNSMPFIVSVWPSDANFLLIETVDQNIVVKTCSENGILIRAIRPQANLKNGVRITVGLPEENKQLISILNKIGCDV